MSAHTDMILSEVAAERERQVELWGRQHLADNDGTDDGTLILGRSYAVLEIMLKARCDHLKDEWKAGRGDPRNMTVVLLEEVFEALAQAVHGDPEQLRRELGQVAAVAVKWMEIIDCRLAEELERETDGLYAATGRRRGLNFDEVKSLRTNRPEIIAKPMIVDLTLPEEG